MCNAVALPALCGSKPIVMREGILGFGEDQEHSKIGQPLFLETKSEGCFALLLLTRPPQLQPCFH